MLAMEVVVLTKSKVREILSELDNAIIEKKLFIEKMEGLLKQKSVIEQTRDALSFIPEELEDMDSDIYEEFEDLRFKNMQLDVDIRYLYDELAKK